jgi:hypothetical protein
MPTSLQPERRRSNCVAVCARCELDESTTRPDFENASGRVTWQMTPRNQVGGFWTRRPSAAPVLGATAGLAEPARVSPEAVGVLGRPLNVWQATWSSPLSSRFSPRRGFSGTYFGVGNFERVPNSHARPCIRVAEQCANAVRRTAASLDWSTDRRISARPTPGILSLARVVLLRNRRAQPEDRLPAHADADDRTWFHHNTRT